MDNSITYLVNIMFILGAFHFKFHAAGDLIQEGFLDHVRDGFQYGHWVQTYHWGSVKGVGGVFMPPIWVSHLSTLQKVHISLLEFRPNPLISFIGNVHMTQKISHLKNKLIQEAFHRRVKWHFSFCNIFFCCRDIQVFLLCRFGHWWCHRLY